ncbi:NADPH-dependent 1-acyl dihydroxyacetone phosphate reductase [Marasmius crinis-equi]|uniref:NADPH-dependent 1-acyl dihydroxyacetone phosphate reductase n=1 Tax=Marasmius crinis-equi TaxID=585013 RepID=A0ABR3FMH6_9AGAR
MPQAEPGQKVVFVTGCSDGGIGAAIVLELASKGCFVYASARSVASMSTLEGPCIAKLDVDVADDESVRRATDEIYQREGRVDIVVSNAGVGCTGPILDISVDRARNTFDTNVFGLMRIVHNIVPRMAERARGLVVVIGSVRSEVSTPFTGIYSSSKAAVRTYTETLAMECQPLGIDVMLINPGSVTSNIVKNQGNMYHMPEKSLYKGFQDAIVHVMFQSQSKRWFDIHYEGPSVDTSATGVAAHVVGFIKGETLISLRDITLLDSVYIRELCTILGSFLSWLISFQVKSLRYNVLERDRLFWYASIVLLHAVIVVREQVSPGSGMIAFMESIVTSESE